MRTLARQFGCELTFSGVLLAKSACHRPLFNKANYRITDDEHPVGAQILGTEPDVMALAAKTLRDVGYDCICLNYACPAPKVLRRGRGGAMLKTPALAIEIFKRVREAVDCPITVKIRTGFGKASEEQENFWEICEKLIAENIDAITVHPRAVTQAYRGKADWELSAKLKGKFPHATILGSGDLFEAVDVINKLKASGLDGVAIARGAIGAPWIYRQLTDVLDGKIGDEIYSPSVKEQGEIILAHYEMLSKLYYVQKSVKYFRKFLANYCKAHPQRKKVHRELMMANTGDELREIIKEFYGHEDT
ncbi:MAG: tRNA-dihydrouridine synthase family protein [Anaerohalosphaeraceae bacterium]|nr:tRNA-dihydrouridine synthase family protein [Anaerohalosphaeraceae bacterium]